MPDRNIDSLVIEINYCVFPFLVTYPRMTYIRCDKLSILVDGLIQVSGLL